MKGCARADGLRVAAACQKPPDHHCPSPLGLSGPNFWVCCRTLVSAGGWGKQSQQ